MIKRRNKLVWTAFGLVILLLAVFVDGKIYNTSLREEWASSYSIGTLDDFARFRAELKSRPAYLIWRRAKDDRLLESDYGQKVTDRILIELRGLVRNALLELYDEALLQRDWNVAETQDSLDAFLSFIGRYKASDEAFMAREKFWLRLPDLNVAVPIEVTGNASEERMAASELFHLERKIAAMGFSPTRESNSENVAIVPLVVEFNKFPSRTWTEVGGSESFREISYSMRMKLDLPNGRSTMIFQGTDHPTDVLGLPERPISFDDRSDMQQLTERETVGSYGTKTYLPQGSLSHAALGAEESLNRIPFIILSNMAMDGKSIQFESMIRMPRHSQQSEEYKRIMRTISDEEHTRREISLGWINSLIQNVAATQFERDSSYGLLVRLEYVMSVLETQEYFGLGADSEQVQFAKSLAKLCGHLYGTKTSNRAKYKCVPSNF